MPVIKQVEHAKIIFKSQKHDKIFHFKTLLKIINDKINKYINGITQTTMYNKSQLYRK